MSYLSKVIYSAGGAGSYAVPFPFISREHVFVLDGAVAYTGTVSWLTDEEISLSPDIAGDHTVTIARHTEINDPLAVFNAGSVTSPDLNLDVLQLLYLIQETLEGRTTTVVVEVPGENPLEYIEISLSDESTALTTANGIASWFLGYNFTLESAFIGLGKAQSSSGNVTVNVKHGGTTIFSTQPSIQPSEDTSLTGTQAVISNSALVKGTPMTADLVAAGTGAKGLKLVLVGRRT